MRISDWSSDVCSSDLVAIGAIAFEAISRLGSPQPVAGGTVIVVASIGIVINTATALLFARGRKGDLNIRGAFIHMAADAAVSAGVVVGALAMMATGAARIDPVMILVIAAVLLRNAYIRKRARSGKECVGREDLVG